MENPATWGLAERVVSKVLDEHNNILPQFICGLSLERRITDALRDAGLLKEENEEEEGLPAAQAGEAGSRRRPEPPDIPAGRPASAEVHDGKMV